MSKTQLTHFIEGELEKLNQKIDLKILEGESFKRDALRHRLLLSQYKRLKRQERFRGVFKNAFRFASFF